MLLQPFFFQYTLWQFYNSTFYSIEYFLSMIGARPDPHLLVFVTCRGYEIWRHRSFFFPVSSCFSILSRIAMIFPLVQFLLLWPQSAFPSSFLFFQPFLWLPLTVTIVTVTKNCYPLLQGLAIHLSVHAITWFGHCLGPLFYMRRILSSVPQESVHRNQPSPLVVMPTPFKCKSTQWGQSVKYPPYKCLRLSNSSFIDASHGSAFIKTSTESRTYVDTAGNTAVVPKHCSGARIPSLLIFHVRQWVL